MEHTHTIIEEGYLDISTETIVGKVTDNIGGGSSNIEHDWGQ